MPGGPPWRVRIAADPSLSPLDSEVYLTTRAARRPLGGAGGPRYESVAAGGGGLGVRLTWRLPVPTFRCHCGTGKWASSCARPAGRGVGRPGPGDGPGCCQRRRLVR